jgi:DNA polymerase elongation subunit (family B)
MVRVVDFYPYFYVPDPNGPYRSIFGEPLSKVVAPDPSKVPEMRSKYPKHYEADIPYTRRFLIDTGIYDCVEFPAKEAVTTSELSPASCDIPLRVWYIDIEVYSETLPDASEPDKPVCSITIYDTYAGKYVTLALGGTGRTVRGNDWAAYWFQRDIDLLRAFWELLSNVKPDVIVGWNVEFDVSYLLNRSKKLGLHPKLEGCQVFDLLEGFRRLQKRSSYKLKAVAVEEGLISEYRSFTVNMKPEEMIEYNRNDVWIMVELDRKYGILDFHLQLKTLVGLNNLEDTLYNSILVDTALLRLARAQGVVLPSKREEEEDVEYEGAVVLEPPAGIFDGVAVFDMARYYPNIIISFNISPDTMDTNGPIRYPPTGVAFRAEEGLIPRLVKGWLKLREGLEASGAPKSKVDAVKFLANSVYGVFAYEKSRLYDVRLASTVTAIGREGILFAKSVAEKMGYRVLYGDTDSLHIQAPFDRAQEVVTKLNEEVERYFKERYGVRECTISLKFEKYFSKMMYFGVKKRYAGLLVWEKGKQKDGELVTVGLDAVRTDQSRFSKEFQEKLLLMALRGASYEEIRRAVEEAKQEMMNRPLIDIAIVKGLSKSLDEYKANAPHVRAVLYSNKHLGTRFGKGSRVYILWVKDVNGLPKTDVIAFDEDTKLPKLVVDWEKMYEVNVLQKAKPILEVLTVRGYSDLRRWF